MLNRFTILAVQLWLFKFGRIIVFKAVLVRHPLSVLFQVAKLMNSDEFRMMRKVMEADEDMEVVTRETDQFVNWLNQHEATSIPCAIRMSATNIEQNDIAEACEI